ncbi:MAG: DEAD/DEAH box helicase [Gemmataceae bacterium]|nr:DEAD/DEAH box helicase [Gemmataceae bacterium]
MTAVPLTKSTSGFRVLGLQPALVAVLDRVGYTQPTPIQAAFIPRALAGRDIVGQAQTGTGKTAAFVLPFLNGWRDLNEPGPQAIILAPTRELVVQVGEEAKKLTHNPRCRTLAIYGGQRIRRQLDELKRGVSIVVGSPGRVLDHLARRTLSLARIRYVVLDEADRMLDIGFRPDIERILRHCPGQRQTLLLSATMPPPVMRLVHRYMVEPEHINLAPEKVTVENIRQTYISVDEDRKFDLLLRVLALEKPRQCIIFCQRKLWAYELYKQLRHHHKRAAVMHGDLDQKHRELIMKHFRTGAINCLVATDVVGRGIDVMGISHIINYDLPEDPENYVHRIGRTGRMGKDGIAIAFVTREQGEDLTKIEAFINLMIPEDRIDGFEACRPRPAEAVEKKVIVPLFGRRQRRYSRRV